MRSWAMLPTAGSELKPISVDQVLPSPTWYRYGWPGVRP